MHMSVVCPSDSGDVFIVSCAAERDVLRPKSMNDLDIAMLVVVTWWILLDFRLPEEVERSRGVLKRKPAEQRALG